MCFCHSKNKIYSLRNKIFLLIKIINIVVSACKHARRTRIDHAPRAPSPEGPDGKYAKHFLKWKFIDQGPIQIIERETIRETIKVVYRFSFRLSLSFLVYKSCHSFLVSFLVQFFSFIVSPIQIIMLAQTRNEKPYEKRMKFIVGSELTRKFRSELFQPLKLIVFTPNFVHKYYKHFSIE